MKRSSVLLGCLLSTALYAQSNQTFRDNTDVSIVLSDSNYNRLVVRGDKIIAAHFPESALSVKNEPDGSLYAVVVQKEPFTLFVTTENGHHFSATVNTESSLGKTIEFVPSNAPIAQKPMVSMPSVMRSPDAKFIETLMSHLVAQKSLAGFSIQHHYGRAIRLQEGLVLLPKLTYVGKTLKGEVTEIYNGGKRPLDLYENLFMGEGVKAVSLSTSTILPKQKAHLYRVMENQHG